MHEKINIANSEIENPQRSARKGMLGSMAASLLVDRAYAQRRIPGRIDRKMYSKLHREYSPHPDAAGNDQVRDYEEYYKQTKLWHGTGRFQYDEDGRQIDVLDSILRQGSVAPALDEFDFMEGSMISTSLARSRMYARAYADIHGKVTEEKHRYGDAGFWGTYVTSRLPIDTLLEAKLWSRKGRKEVRAKIGKGDRRPWGAKAHAGFVKDEDGAAEFRGIFTPFFTGSDIEGNYPILFGIKEPLKETETAKSIARHEVRTKDLVGLASVSHIEVPFDRMAETQYLLEKRYVSIPVLAIETGEEFCSRRSFSELVYPNSLAV